jgi:hypothetical protein
MVKLHLQLAGVGLDKKDTFGKSDPYFQVWAQDATAAAADEDGGGDDEAAVLPVVSHALYVLCES